MKDLPPPDCRDWVESLMAVVLTTLGEWRK